jgi:hypothetical protein
MSRKNVFPYDRRNFTLSFNVDSEPEYYIDNEKDLRPLKHGKITYKN